MDLGERIATLRTRRGINQSELARALGLKPQAVQAWEKGGGIRPAKFQPIADALGVTLAELLLGDAYAQPPPDPQPDRDVLLYAHGLIHEHLARHGHEFEMDKDVDLLCLVYAWAVKDGGQLSPESLIELGQRLSPRTHGGSDEIQGGARRALTTVR